MEIFKLFGSIFVNTDDADKSMQKTEKNAESIASKLGSGITTAAKWGAGLVTAATAATTAVVGLANDAAGTADEIDKMSQKIGISAEAYQEWSYVMGQNGMDVEKLSTGMKTLVSQMDSAASGSASAQENFNKLGISIYDSSGKLKDQETILNETMHALADMENGTEKARLATELFGKAGIEMMPMLNQGSGAMDELTQRAHDLGLVMSDEAVSAGVNLGDTIDDIKKSFSMIGTNLGSAVIPIIQQFADLIIDNMPMIQQTIGQLGPILANMAATFLPVIADLAQMLLPLLVDLINQLLPVITNIASIVLPIITELLEKLMPPLMQIIGAILPVITTLLNTLMPIIDLLFQILNPILDVILALIVPLVELASVILQPIIELLGALITTALEPLMPVIETVASLLTMTLGAAFKTLEPIIENIQQVFVGLIDFITGIFSDDWEKAWNGIVNIFSGIFSAVSDIFKAPINFIINGINSLFASLGNLKIPDWVPIIGGTSFDLPQIPMLWKGGDIVESGSVLVGEKGPEILELPAGARVTPLDNANDNTNLTKDDLIDAIRTVLSEGYINLSVEATANRDRLFDDIAIKNTEWKKQHGMKSRFA